MTLIQFLFLFYFVSFIGRPFVKRFALCYGTVVCLSVLSVCLSVTLVYCGQTVGWSGMQVGLGPGHTVLDGDPATPPQKGTSHQFSAHICCGQTAGWTKMPLGVEVGLGQGDFVLNGDPAPLPKKGAEPAPQFLAHVCCGQTAGWTKVQNATWHGGRPRPRRHCVRWGLGTQLSPKKGHSPPNFRYMSIVTKQLYVSGYHLVWR